MEDKNAYQVNEYRGIPVTYDKGACYWFKACYFHSGYSDIERINTMLENFWFDELWVQYVSVNNFEFRDNRPQDLYI